MNRNIGVVTLIFIAYLKVAVAAKVVSQMVSEAFKMKEEKLLQT